MDRTQRLLIIALVVQIALLLVVHNPFAKKGAATEQTMIPALASMTPEKLEVSGPGEATVTFVKREGIWTLANPDGYPALPGKLDKLIQDLGHLKAGRQVVSSSRYHASLKVADADFERRVRVWEKPSDTPKVELYIGTSPSYGVTHMRLAGSDKVFETTGINSYDIPVEPGGWIERSLTMVPATEVTALQVANKKGKFALEKKEGGWGLAGGGKPLDSDKVTQLIGTLCGMSIEEPVAVDAKSQGLDSPEATLVFKRVPAHADSVAPQPVTVTVRIGALVQDKQEKRFAARADFPFGGTVAKYGYDRALSVTLADLLKK